MCIAYAMRMIVDRHPPHASAALLGYGVWILVAGYAFIWFYWQGANWARVSVMIVSLVTIADLANWNDTQPVVSLEHAQLVSDAVLGLFLLYWLNTSRIRAWFRDDPDSQPASPV
jgi:hypothetical protein